MLLRFIVSLIAAIAVSQAHAQEVAVEPTPINNAGPRLTAQLLEEERGGTARVAFTITTTGEVKDVELRSSSGVPAFDDLALEAVRAWTFNPARDADDNAVEVRGVAPIGFRTPNELQGDVADHLSRQLGQTCSQFLADVAAAGPSTPEELPKAVASFRELWAAAFASLIVSGDKPSVIVSIVEAEQTVFDNVVAGCGSDPESRLGDHFNAALQQQLSLARSER